MNDLEKLIRRCNEMDITEQINWLGDAIMPMRAAAELTRLQAIEKAAEDLFQACAYLPLPEMDRMEKEISALATALS